MSKLVFLILCAAAGLIYSKWKQDPKFLDAFLRKIFGQKDPPTDEDKDDVEDKGKVDAREAPREDAPRGRSSARERKALDCGTARRRMASETARRVLPTQLGDRKDGNHTDDDIDPQDDNDDIQSSHRKKSRRKAKSRNKSTYDRPENDPYDKKHLENYMKSPRVRSGDRVFDLDNLSSDAQLALAAGEEALKAEGEPLKAEEEEAFKAEDEAVRQRRKERKKRKAAKGEAAGRKDKRLASSSDDEDTRPVTDEFAKKVKHPKGSKQKLLTDSEDDEYFLREKAIRSEQLRKEEQERRRIKARKLREAEDLEDEEDLGLNQRRRQPQDRRMQNDREEMASARRGEQEGDFERVEPQRQRRRQRIRNFADQGAEEDEEEYLSEYGEGPPLRRRVQGRGNNMARARGLYEEREVDSGGIRGDPNSRSIELNDQAGYQQSDGSAPYREARRRQGMNKVQYERNEGANSKDGISEPHGQEVGQGISEEIVGESEDVRQPVVDERKALEEKRLAKKRAQLQKLLLEQEITQTRTQERRSRKGKTSVDSKGAEMNAQVLSDKAPSEIPSQTTPAVTPQPTEAEADTGNHLQDSSVSKQDGQQAPHNEFSSHKASTHKPSQKLSAIQTLPRAAADTAARLETAHPPISKGQESVLLKSPDNPSYFPSATRLAEAKTPKPDVLAKKSEGHKPEPDTESSWDEIPSWMFSEKASADQARKAKKAKRREVLVKDAESEPETDIQHPVPTVRASDSTGIRLNDPSARQSSSEKDVSTKEDVKSNQVRDTEPSYEGISTWMFSEEPSASQKRKGKKARRDPPVKEGSDGLWNSPGSKGKGREKGSKSSSEKMPLKMTFQTSLAVTKEPSISDPPAPFENEGPTISSSKGKRKKATSNSSQQGGSELPPFYDNVYRGPESLQDASAPPPEYGRPPPGDKTLVESQDAPEDYYPPSGPSLSNTTTEDTWSQQRTRNKPRQPGDSNAGEGSSKKRPKANQFNLADVSAPDSEEQQHSASKPSNSSASTDVKEAIAELGRKSGKGDTPDVGFSSSYPDEKRKVQNNGYNQNEIPDYAASGGNHLAEPVAVNRIEIPEDPPLTIPSNYGNSGKDRKAMEIVDSAVEEPEAQRQMHEDTYQDIEPFEMRHLADSRKAKKASPSKAESNAVASRSPSELETSSSVKDNFKRLCHNAKLCKKRTIASVFFFAVYIAFTCVGSSYMIVKSPSVPASNVVKRQSLNTSGIEETVSSVTDAFQDTEISLGTLQSHPLLISNLWHLFSQMLIIYLISSIYSHIPVEEEAGREKSESQPRKSRGSWWTRITDRVTRTRAWFQRRLGRWSFARYFIIIALFGISILVARQLTSLSYISRDPSATEPWSTYPDVALLYDRLRANQKGLASGVTLLQASICFWFVVVFTGAYCISTLADEPVPVPRDIEQGKGDAEA